MGVPRLRCASVAGAAQLSFAPDAFTAGAQSVTCFCTNAGELLRRHLAHGDAEVVEVLEELGVVERRHRGLVQRVDDAASARPPGRRCRRSSRRRASDSPSSTTVGTSGAIDARLVDVTASSRSLPDFWNCTFCGSVSIANRIVPPSRSLCIGEEPLYPTCVQLDAGLRLEEFADDVADRADAAAAVGDRVLLLLRPRDELGDRLRRHRRMHDEHVGHRADVRDVREALDRIVGRRLEHERRQADRRGVRHHQRVAVGRGARDLGRADRRARAGLVVDDDRLAELLGQQRRRAGARRRRSIRRAERSRRRAPASSATTARGLPRRCRVRSTPAAAQRSPSSSSASPHASRWLRSRGLPSSWRTLPCHATVSPGTPWPANRGCADSASVTGTRCSADSTAKVCANDGPALAWTTRLLGSRVRAYTRFPHRQPVPSPPAPATGCAVPRAPSRSSTTTRWRPPGCASRSTASCGRSADEGRARSPRSRRRCCSTARRCRARSTR